MFLVTKESKMSFLFKICMLSLQINSFNNFNVERGIARPIFPFFQPSFTYISFIVDPAVMAFTSTQISDQSSSKFAYKSYDLHGNEYDINKESKDIKSQTTIKIVLKGKKDATVTLHKETDDTYTQKIEPKNGDKKEDLLDKEQSKRIDNIIEELINASKSTSKVDIKPISNIDVFSPDFSKNVEKEFDEEDKKRKEMNEKISKILQKLLEFT